MKIKCPGCSAVLNIPESAAGKVVKCPCGKQLRAPGGPGGGAKPAAQKPATGNPGAGKPAAAKPAAARPGAARPAAAKPAAGRPAAARPAAPARPSTPAAADGFDAAMFDELTDQDLKPMPSARAAAPQGVPAGGGKLMQQYAPSGSGGVGGGQFRRGPIASPWVRFGAALLDGFIIGFIVAPILFGGTFLLGSMMVDTDAIRNAQTEAQQEALAAQAAGSVMIAYAISAIVAYSIPITIYAIMVTKSGQTPGKKICGVRIVTSDRQELPGFVKGVLMRSWVMNIIYAIPLLGAVVMLVDYLMIFSQNRQCLHDQLAGTLVIES